MMMPRGSDIREAEWAGLRSRPFHVCKISELIAAPVHLCIYIDNSCKSVPITRTLEHFGENGSIVGEGLRRICHVHAVKIHEDAAPQDPAVPLEINGHNSNGRTWLPSVCLTVATLLV